MKMKQNNTVEKKLEIKYNDHRIVNASNLPAMSISVYANADNTFALPCYTEMVTYERKEVYGKVTRFKNSLTKHNLFFFVL